MLDEAKEAGVPIYTIAFGTPDGTVEITNDFGVTQTYNVPPDPDTLRRVAEETGGRFFEAPTEADLEEVYKEIGSQVSYEDEKRELTAVFAGAARSSCCSAALCRRSGSDGFVGSHPRGGERDGRASPYAGLAPAPRGGGGRGRRPDALGVRCLCLRRFLVRRLPGGTPSQFVQATTASPTTRGLSERPRPRRPAGRFRGVGRPELVAAPEGPPRAGPPDGPASSPRCLPARAAGRRRCRAA